MATVIYERRGSETKIYATAVTYPSEDSVARCTVYPSAPESAVREERMDDLVSYRSKNVDIPLSRVVRVER